VIETISTDSAGVRIVAAVASGNVTLATPWLRAIVGAGVAAAIAILARRGHALSASGAVAAVACGAASAAAGWAYAALLVVYFVASSLVTAAGRKRKEAQTAPVAEKGGERDAAQVIANGGVFCLAALATLTATPGSPIRDMLAGGALGALAASAADTWSTEIGVLMGGVPRSIINRTVVRKGESGGVTWAGSAGGRAGAVFIALAGAVLGIGDGLPLAPIVGGMTGTLLDSLLGATLQRRRHCDTCDLPTERAIHTCGAPTRDAGGVRWIGNDTVNLLATVGGLVAGGAIGMAGARG
jgi:uncharacterized protein (TIGR00297 family)